MSKAIENLIPILLLLVAVALVLWRLPKTELRHSAPFRRRRVQNWLPLGLTYAFLYFGRYNINEGTSALKTLIDNDGFGKIFGAGAFVYGFSFLINGPLTDRLGGRTTILLAAGGSAVANVLLGALVYAVVGKGFIPPGGLVLWMGGLYGLNMYFQSFGAVSIVKVNAAWFHVRERGVQGGIFGILISLGIYFGYDWSRMIVQAAPASPWLAFFVPAAILVVFFVVDIFWVQDSPKNAGHDNFDVGDGGAIDDGVAAPSLGFSASLKETGGVFMLMLRNPVIMLIVAIEFCTGFLRNGVMSWYPKFAKATGMADDFVATNWGMLLCVFGIVGGMFAGIISDRVFNSRRGPVATVLYAGITVGAIAMYFALSQPFIGWVLVFMALNYVGVHGMLSGTASADFGGRKNTGVAVGIIDGFVYLGTGLQSVIVGGLLPTKEAAAVSANWINWPLAMIPIAIVGLVLCTRMWNAKAGGAAAH